MVVDCTSLCLLAIAVGLKASYDTEKCSYCMDVRGLSPACDADPMSCVEQDSNSLIYCLTINELPRQSDHIRRVVRCLSHSAFNISLDELHDAMVLSRCHFDTMRPCDCPNCRQNQLVSSVSPTDHPRQIFKVSISKGQENIDVDSNDFDESIIHLENSTSIQHITNQPDVLLPTGFTRQTKLKAGNKKNDIPVKPFSLQHVIGRGGTNEQVVSSSEQSKPKSSSSTFNLNELPLPIISMASSEKKNSKPTSLLKLITIQRSALSHGIVENVLNETRMENKTRVSKAGSHIVSHALTHSEDVETSPSSASRLHFILAAVARSILTLGLCESYVNNLRFIHLTL